MTSRSRQSILCPNCNKLISRDEPACPHCGLARPGLWWRGSRWSRSLLSGEHLITYVVGANVAMYVISLLLNPSHLALSANPLRFLSPSSRVLLLLGGTGTIPIGLYHRWWTLLSANYLHGGILHIAFNMIALWQIAPLVLVEYGASRSISIYTLGGVLGFFLSYLAGVRLTIGASAAICSLIGAALYYGKSRGGSYGQAVYKQVGGWVIAIFLFGLLLPGIDNWGHGGGIVAGIVLGFLLGYEEKKQENLFHKCLAAVCIVLTLATLLWATVSGFYYRFF